MSDFRKIENISYFTLLAFALILFAYAFAFSGNVSFTTLTSQGEEASIWNLMRTAFVVGFVFLVLLNLVNWMYSTDLGQKGVVGLQTLLHKSQEWLAVFLLGYYSLPVALALATLHVAR